MCTIVVLRKVRNDYPLVLATNRDEFYARLSSGPERLLEQPLSVGGRDLVKGGTWMGVTRDGLFVGVTNQRTLVPPDPSKRSRGELVMNALRLGTTQAIAAFLRGIDGREYNAFNLLWGDAHELFAAYAREGQAALEVEPVPEGVHVLPNDRLDSADFPKVARAQALLAPHLHGPYARLEQALKDMLADRALPQPDALPDVPLPKSMDRAFYRQLSALCIRTPIYGTRTSTVVALTPGGVGRYLYADGPPDQSEFRDVTPMLSDGSAAAG